VDRSQPACPRRCSATRAKPPVQQTLEGEGPKKQGEVHGPSLLALTLGAVAVAWHWYRPFRRIEVVCLPASTCVAARRAGGAELLPGLRELLLGMTPPESGQAKGHQGGRSGWRPVVSEPRSAIGGGSSSCPGPGDHRDRAESSALGQELRPSKTARSSRPAPPPLASTKAFQMPSAFGSLATAQHSAANLRFDGALNG